MISLISGALLLSVDSLLVSFALGTCGIERRQQSRLAIAFGFCDGAASFVGALLGVCLAARVALFGHLGGPLLIAAYAVIMLAMARLGRSMIGPGGRMGMPMLLLLPLVMSLDNLAASSTLGSAGSPLTSAIIMGVISGLVSLFGFRAGEFGSSAIGRLRNPLGFQWNGAYHKGIILLAVATLLAVS